MPHPFCFSKGAGFDFVFDLLMVRFPYSSGPDLFQSPNRPPPLPTSNLEPLTSVNLEPLNHCPLFVRSALLAWQSVPMLFRGRGFLALSLDEGSRDIIPDMTTSHLRAPHPRRPCACAEIPALFPPPSSDAALPASHHCPLFVRFAPFLPESSSLRPFPVRMIPFQYCT